MTFAPTTPFERAIDKALAEVEAAVWRVPLGDSHRLALLQGQREGLTRAKLLWRKADGLVLEEDPDDIPI